jgi:hypothetical protein
MGKRNTPPQAPVTIDIGARAEAKFELKGEVPSSSLGRLVDALTDAIRPFTERQGLKADQIRLQRAEVAIEIARLARKKIEAERAKPKPVPNKILVPLIEHASNEDVTDKAMMDRWSDLLASASLNDAVPPIYVQILAQMDGRQARALSKVMLNEYEQWHRPLSTFFEYYEVEPSGVGRSTLRNMEKLNFKNHREAYAFLVDWFTRPGCYLYDVDEEPHRQLDDGEELFRNLGAWYEVGFEEQLEICCALGVLKMEEVNLKLRFSKRVNLITITYYHVTRMGADFLECCARDDLAKLRNIQKEKDDVIRDHLKRSAREYFKNLKENEMPTPKEFDEFCTRWDRDLPAEWKAHWLRRKTQRCRLSNSAL